MINEYLKIPIIIGSISIMGFGIVHLFWPKIFKWDVLYKTLPDVFVDTVNTMNIFMCIELISIGFTISLAVLLFWHNKELVELLLFMASAIILLRTIYGIIAPIRIPVKGIHFLFILLFILILGCFIVPFGIIALKYLKLN
jgi:hypothetical protein